MTCTHLTLFALINTHTVHVNTGRTPLHYAAMHGRIGAVEQLINLGASLGDQDWRGDYTPLHLAADAGQVDMIAKLAQLGADVNVRNSKGYTPLVLATVKVCVCVCARACARMLLKAAARCCCLCCCCTLLGHISI